MTSFHESLRKLLSLAVASLAVAAAGCGSDYPADIVNWTLTTSPNAVEGTTSYGLLSLNTEGQTAEFFEVHELVDANPPVKLDVTWRGAWQLDGDVVRFELECSSMTAENYPTTVDCETSTLDIDCDVVEKLDGGFELDCDEDYAFEERI